MLLFLSPLPKTSSLCFIRRTQLVAMLLFLSPLPKTSSLCPIRRTQLVADLMSSAHRLLQALLVAVAPHASAAVLKGGPPAELVAATAGTAGAHVIATCAQVRVGCVGCCCVLLHCFVALFCFVIL